MPFVDMFIDEPAASKVNRGMSTPIVWRGVFPASTTQLNEDQSLNLDATGVHLERLIQSGITGLVMCGSLGENQCLSTEEKVAVVEHAVKVAAGRVPVLSGVAEMSTRAGIEYIKKCEDVGASGVMVLPAMVYKADRRETLAHYRTIAKSTSLPILIYNNPVGYTVDITAEMLAELADLPNLQAIKESSADTSRIVDIRNAVGDRYAIFAGVDTLVMECALLGAVGWIAGVGLAFPEENQKIWDLIEAKRYDEAMEIYQWFMPLLRLDLGIHFVQKIKMAIAATGLGTEYVRAPRLMLTGAERAEVEAIIAHGLANRPDLTKYN